MLCWARRPQWTGPKPVESWLSWAPEKKLLAYPAKHIQLRWCVDWFQWLKTGPVKLSCFYQRQTEQQERGSNKHSIAWVHARTQPNHGRYASSYIATSKSSIVVRWYVWQKLIWGLLSFLYLASEASALWRKGDMDKRLPNPWVNLYMYQQINPRY